MGEKMTRRKCTYFLSYLILFIPAISILSVLACSKEVVRKPSLDGRIPFELDAVDTPPRIVRSVAPLIPIEASRNNAPRKGAVKLRFVISKDGDVLEPKVLESELPRIFDSIALKAIKQFKFKPATKNGIAVDCIVVAPINFDQIE